jgi:hypothetical protein
LTNHFRADGGIAAAHLVSQLAGNGQSIDNLAFITSLTTGNLELLAHGGPGTFLKLNYQDSSENSRCAVAIQAGADDCTVSIGPDAQGSAHLDMENNDIVGIENLTASPDGDMSLNASDGHHIRVVGVAYVADQAAPSDTPSHGGYLYSEGGALAWKGSNGTVTVIAPA